MGSKADVVTALGGAGIELGGGAFTAATTDICTKAAHGWETGDGPFQASSDDTLPAGLSADTDYYIVKLTDDTFKLATSYANAIAGTPTVVDITDTGTGAHTISATVAAFVNKLEAAFTNRMQYGNKTNFLDVNLSKLWDDLLQVL